MKDSLLKKLRTVWSVILRSKFLESHLSTWLMSLTLLEFRLNSRDRTFFLFDIRLVPRSCTNLTILGFEVSLVWNIPKDTFLELDLWWLGLPIWSTSPEMTQEIEERKLKEQICKK